MFSTFVSIIFGGEAGVFERGAPPPPLDLTLHVVDNHYSLTSIQSVHTAFRARSRFFWLLLLPPNCGTSPDSRPGYCPTHLDSLTGWERYIESSMVSVWEVRVYFNLEDSAHAVLMDQHVVIQKAECWRYIDRVRTALNCIDVHLRVYTEGWRRVY